MPKSRDPPRTAEPSFRAKPPPSQGTAAKGASATSFGGFLHPWSRRRKGFVTAGAVSTGGGSRTEHLRKYWCGRQARSAESSKPAAAKSYSRQERSFGRFERAFQLADDVDSTKIEASAKNGVLTVKLPKAEKAKARCIAVKSE